MYLWRDIDAEGEMLDVLLESTRDRTAATTLLCDIMRKHSMFSVLIISDKWWPTAAAIRKVVPSAT